MKKYEIHLGQKWTSHEHRLFVMLRGKFFFDDHGRIEVIQTFITSKRLSKKFTITIFNVIKLVIAEKSFEKCEKKYEKTWNS